MVLSPVDRRLRDATGWSPSWSSCYWLAGCGCCGWSD